jgi:hypothetical protein
MKNTRAKTEGHTSKGKFLTNIFLPPVLKLPMEAPFGESNMSRTMGANINLSKITVRI